jgi:8-oxo-dGTP diphosphatase
VILLVRHGRAGKRGHSSDDRLRPLDDKGRRQAARLPDLLTPYAVARVLSSPFTRCLQTVEPLAARLGVAVEQCDALGEGTPADVARDLLASIGETAVACTHGDVIAALIGPGREAKKGSVWVLDGTGLAPIEYMKS